MINAIQQETLADINVDDDGRVGKVTIGSTDGGAVDEARRQIELILDPPTAEVGQIYQGKVVNITKFGAFVNILPGRDGLVHISKLGGGRRIDRVEDVLSLGEEIEVRVDDIDPSGKVSLSPVGDGADDGAGGRRRRRPVVLRGLLRRPRAADSRVRQRRRCAVASTCRSRTASTPSCARSSASSGRARSPPAAARATTGEAVATGAGGAAADDDAALDPTTPSR